MKVKIEPNANKMQELILYVCKQLENDPKFGATKLNKLLFFCDFLAYLKLGQAITEATYQKLEHGPAPKCLVPLREGMISNGIAAPQQTTYMGNPQNRLIALRDAELSVFNAKEVALIDSIICCFKDYNGKEMSDLSHKFSGWKLANLKEEIPYQVALVESPEELPESVILKANQLMEKAA
jgi:hypothetical protein